MRGQPAAQQRFGIARTRRAYTNSGETRRYSLVPPKNRDDQEADQHHDRNRHDNCRSSKYYGRDPVYHDAVIGAAACTDRITPSRIEPPLSRPKNLMSATSPSQIGSMPFFAGPARRSFSTCQSPLLTKNRTGPAGHRTPSRASAT